MKFCAAVVLTFTTATAASDSYDRSLHRPSCPPPQYPPPPPRADGRAWVWVCTPNPPPRPSWNNDGHSISSISSQDVKWEDDGHDDTWAGDAHVEANGSDDGHIEADDGTWSDDGHDDAVTDDDGWNGDGYEEAPQEDDYDEEVNDDAVDRSPPEEEDDGVEEVDSWGDDDAAADKHPAISESQLEEDQYVHDGQDTKSIPVGAIAGAAAAAVAAAILALVVARRRKDEEFVDVGDKDSISTSTTPPPEARMVKDGDIEIDHTFFDENLFQQNYQEQEQELAYQDMYPEDDLSTINEDLGFTGDDVSI
jgi:hypothetical protein